MPPLHIALLRELSRWIDVRVYAVDPCREFWFDIVSDARVEQLEMADERDYPGGRAIRCSPSGAARRRRNCTCCMS